MKKVFRLTAIAVIAMGLATACGSKKTVEVEDTTADTLMTVEAVIDTVVEEEEPVVVEEEPAKPVRKKEVKKEEPTPADIKPTKIGEGNNTNNVPTKTGAKKVNQTVTTTDLNNGASNNVPTKIKKNN